MAKIPDYLDEYIYQNLGGVFQPGMNVDFNLNNDAEANKRYIGTYFPRSFVESYNIFNDLYANGNIRRAIENKPELRILDIGTGTGGNIIGLMHFLKSVKFDKPVEFITIEGNDNAIEYQRRFFRKFNDYFGTDFKLSYANLVFSSTTLNSQLKGLLDRLKMKYDIITSFKFISEFYNCDYANSDGLFKKFTHTVSNYLDEKGIFLLLDLVSGDYEHRNIRPFTTQIMSDELNKYVNNPASSLAYIIPVCCGLWSNGCRTSKCYIERQFEISHSKRDRDVSKVCYRVLTGKSFAREILDDIPRRSEYQMSFNTWHPKLCKRAFLLKKNNGNQFANAFKLN